MTSLTIAEPEAIQMRTIIYEFYGSMNPNNIIDLDVTDNGLFTLPPFLYINENISSNFTQNEIKYSINHQYIINNNLAQY